MIDSPLCYFLILPLLAALGHGIAAKVPFYRKLQDEPQTGRRGELDALRGLLATGVFFQHCVVYHAYLTTGDWHRPVSPFYAALGELSVVLFFMITGYLFWDRVLQGRQPPLQPFYRARFRRIAPLGLLAMTLVAVAVGIETGWALREPPLLLFRHLVQLFSLGVLPVSPINGSSPHPVNGGITWTLGYEWLFYLALPGLARIARSRWLVALLVGVVALSVVEPKALHLLSFAGGMGTAYLLQGGHLARIGRGPLALGATVGAAAVLTGVPAYTWPGLACALLVFLAVARDGSEWPLLRLPGLRQLGVVSYSLYLLHGLVLWAGTRILVHLAPDQALEPLVYWCAMTGCGLAAVGLAAVTYRWVEYPFLRDPLRTATVRT